MTATIQKILKPTKYRAVDTSGNNNHGQIYSGRALEFDGVADYLDLGASTTFVDFSAESTAANRTWTVAAWINYDAVSSVIKNVVGDGNVTRSASYICIGTDEKLNIYDLEGAAWRAGNTVLQPQTWYRAVWSFEGVSTVTFYLNGIADGTGDIGTSNDAADDKDLRFRYIGIWDPAQGVPRYWEGKMSDVQAWQGAWTASDALFDYLNPESLALNNGGTSLTESNLKLWYPMQDGHRGQQSYVLDGANTGLCDEIATNGDISDGATGFLVEDNGPGSTMSVSTEQTYGGNSQSLKFVVLGTGDGAKTSITGKFIAGTTYKVSAWIYTSNTVTLNPGNSYFADSGNTVNTSVNDEWAEVVCYMTCDVSSGSNPTDGLFIQTANSGTTTFYIGQLSIKPVNDKHHATSVFYGDEKVTNGDCEVTDPTTVTIGGVAAAPGDHSVFDDSETVAHAGSKSLKVVGDSSSTYPKITWADGSDMGLVAGRTYYVECWAYIPSGNSLIDTVQLKVNSNGSSSVLVNSQTTATDTWTKLSGTFVDDDIANIQFIGYDASGSPGGAQNFSSEVFYMDDLTVKEVGTATGWTDADQELDIPQTALQSYNQLAWFDGVDDKVVIGDQTKYSFSADVAFSISAWINMNDATSFPIVEKYKSGNREYRFHGAADDKLQFLLYDESAGAWERARTSSAVLTAYENEWIHVVATYNGDESNAETGIRLYINGESQTLSTDDDGTYVAMESLAGDVWIGASELGATYANGAITEVGIFDVNLTQAEVSELYNDGKAIDALTHSQESNKVGYWRNNGLASWQDLKNPTVTTFNGTVTCAETLLLPAGVDASRDNQGFLMNRQKDTNALNFYTPSYLSTNVPDNKEAPYVYIPKAPLMTNSTAVTNFSICSWVKFHNTPDDANSHMSIYDDAQDGDDETAKGMKFYINSDNYLTCVVYWGIRNGGGDADYIYLTYDLDNIDQATITNPHSFGTDGMWNGTQTSMALNKGIGHSSSTFPPDEWFHVAATFDHDNAESQTSATGDHTANPATNITNEAPFYAYVNGILVAKNGLDGNDQQAVADNFDKTMYATADHPAILGSDMQSNAGQPGNNSTDTWGKIDDLLIYSDTLTSQEVLRIYNAGKRSHK